MKKRNKVFTIRLAFASEKLEYVKRVGVVFAIVALFFVIFTNTFTVTKKVGVSRKLANKVFNIKNKLVARVSAPTFDCSENVCIVSPSETGTYPSVARCAEQCPRYECDTTNYQCVLEIGGNFIGLNSCLQGCTPAFMPRSQ